MVGMHGLEKRSGSTEGETDRERGPYRPTSATSQIFQRGGHVLPRVIRTGLSQMRRKLKVVVSHTETR